MAAEDITEIHLFAPGFEEFFSRFSQPIGKGEVFVPTEETVPAGSKVELVFCIVYEDMELLRLSGAVAYLTDSSGKIIGSGPKGVITSGQGICIKIDDMNEIFKAYIIELVKRQYRSDLSHMFTT